MKAEHIAKYKTWYNMQPAKMDRKSALYLESMKHF